MVTTSKPAVGFRGLYVAALAAWFLVTAIALGCVVRDSIATVETAFHRYTESVIAELRDKLKANEAVLAGFSSFLSAVEANDSKSCAKSFAAWTMAEVASRTGLVDWLLHSTGSAIPAAQRARYAALWLPPILRGCSKKPGARLFP